MTRNSAHRSRDISVARLASTIWSVEVYLRDLAAQLGLPGTSPLTPTDGETMTALLGKQKR